MLRWLKTVCYIILYLANLSVILCTFNEGCKSKIKEIQTRIIYVSIIINISSSVYEYIIIYQLPLSKIPTT